MIAGAHPLDGHATSVSALLGNPAGCRMPRVVSWPARRLASVVSEEVVRGAMRGVIDPELGDDLVDLGMYQDCEISDDGSVTVRVALTTAGWPKTERCSTVPTWLTMVLYPVGAA